MLYDNTQQRGVLLSFILPCMKPMVSVSPLKFCCDTSLIPYLDETLEIRCRERKFAMYLKGAGNFPYSACTCFMGKQAFFLYRSTSKFLRSADLLHVLNSAAETQKQPNPWQTNKQHYTNPSEP